MGVSLCWCCCGRTGKLAASAATPGCCARGCACARLAAALPKEGR